MNIGFDVTVLVGNKRTGIANYVYSLIQALLKIDKENNYTLLGITSLKAYPYLRNLKFVNAPNANLKAYRMPSKLFHRIFAIWQTLQFPPIEWLTGSIDVFHSFDWFCPSSKKAKIIATIFDVTPLTHPEWHTPGNIEQHTRRLKNIQKQADLIITISQASKKDIVEVLKINPEKIFVAYPGVDRKRFYPIKNKDLLSKVLKKYNLRPGYILFVGTWYPHKNITRLIKAYKILRRQKKFKQNLVLVGKKNKKARRIKLGKDIILADYIPKKDLPFIYNGASVFVFPSLYEGFGMPVIEAMACGCPVITSSTNSLPEAAGTAAILIDPYNIKDITRGIEKILVDTRLSNNLCQRGLEQAKKFTWEKCARITLKTYEGLIR